MSCSNTKYTVYTDGAYSSLHNSGGIGVIILRDNELIYTYSKNFTKTTNQKMEVTAVIYALNMLKDAKHIKIITDSMYTIGCASLGWKRKKNIQLWKVFDKYYKQMIEAGCCIEFQHVKGHTGEKYNTMCDALAVAARDEFSFK